MKPRTIPLLAPLLALGLYACGGGGDPAEQTNAGYAALNSGQPQEALASFRRALEAMEADDPTYVRTKLGEIEALVHLDPDKAKEEFLVLARTHPSLPAKDYSLIASKLTAEGQFMPAIDVLDAGLKAHSEDVKLMAILERVKVEATKEGRDDALDKLKGLGYL